MAVKLQTKLHISDAEALSEKLVSCLESSDPIILDISDVNDADTASLQVLCALQKSLFLTQNSIEWSGVSKPLADAAKQLGVHDLLNLPS